MKHLTSIAVLSLLVGCASQAEPARTTVVTPAPSQTASALAFDPPIALGQPAPDLSRDVRGPAALIGFEEPATSTYDVFTYNRQSSDFGDYYDQEAVSEKVGVTHR